MFDVDGVLAEVRSRLPHLEGRPKDWDAFFAAATADPPLTEGVAPAVEAARLRGRLCHRSARTLPS